ncbi:MAG: cobalamin-dependent protein [Bacillota bacterium]
MNQKLVDALAELDEDLVLEEVNAMIGQGVPAIDIINDLQEGMGIVGKRFEQKEYFLSELIMSAEVFNQASELLGSSFDSADSSKNGTYVIGTIYEDIHDIGKNIVSTVVSSNGFKVVDLGVDVPTEKFIEAIKEHQPKVIGISCLLTTCFDNVKECIQAIEDAGLRKDLKITIGGGPVDEETGKYVKADAVCKNAMDTVTYCKAIY